jgi:hypothetical protein
MDRAEFPFAVCDGVGREVAFFFPHFTVDHTAACPRVLRGQVGDLFYLSFSTSNDSVDALPGPLEDVARLLEESTEHLLAQLLDVPVTATAHIQSKLPPDEWDALVDDIA